MKIKFVIGITCSMRDIKSTLFARNFVWFRLFTVLLCYCCGYVIVGYFVLIESSAFTLASLCTRLSVLLCSAAVAAALGHTGDTSMLSRTHETKP